MDDDAEFRRNVAYFWLEKGDPTRYVGWDEDRCSKVWPSFLLLFKNYLAFHLMLDEVARKHE
jgi:hypothetical protein